MTEAKQRQAVVDEAMTWIGTPWHDRARLKGVGVDCAQFPAAVYEAAGIIPHIEPKYDRQWALHNSRELYIEWIKMFAHEIDAAQVKAGDIGAWKFGRAHSHGGIFLAPNRVIHAVTGAGVQIDESDRQEDLRTRSAHYFSIWGN